jgi:hypothetical protein
MPAPTKHTITYNVSVQIPGGPRPPLSGSLTVDALLDYKVPVPKGAHNVVAEIQAGDADDVQFFQMKPDKENVNLKYKLSAGGEWLQVGQLILLAGQGATGVIGGIPAKIWFLNDGEDSTVDILIGRNVISTAPAGGDADGEDDSPAVDDDDDDNGDGDNDGDDNDDSDDDDDAPEGDSGGDGTPKVYVAADSTTTQAPVASTRLGRTGRSASGDVPIKA